jgi:translocation and assembly module TamA
LKSIASGPSLRPRSAVVFQQPARRPCCFSAGAVLLALLIFISTAYAQEIRSYTVEVDGAGEHAEMLREHLDVVRQSEEEHPPEQIERLIETAPEQIRELLATQGFFSPTVRTRFDRAATPWSVRFEVDLGPPTRITEVTIRFKGGIAEGPGADQARMNRLRRRWGLDPGDVFRQSKWTEEKNDLLKDLVTRDYPTASITQSEARIDPKSNSAVLTVEIDSGPAFTFGELDIHGLTRYSRVMVDNANPIKPGDPYSQDKLNELQARLEDSGYFRSAFATLEPDRAHPERVPVRLDLVENPRRRLALGGGFSTNTGARGQVRWLDRNFLLRDWRLESELKVDRETKLIGGDVFLPPISSGWLPTGWLPSFGAHLERTTSSGETEDKLRAGPRVTSPNRFDEKIWALTYYAGRQRTGEVFENNRQALLASFTYTKRRLDHPLRPREGYVASVELGAGPHGIINESNIFRVVTRGTRLDSLAPRWQTVLRAQVGQVFGGSRLTIPGDLLFRAGGDQSVRGYGFNTLGVRQDDAIVGGTVIAVASAELVRRLTPQWGAAVFVDAGNAADSWSDFSLKRGTGVGARWRSPIGPVNIDLAYGHSTHEVRLHFSVGYGF